MTFIHFADETNAVRTYRKTPRRLGKLGGSTTSLESMRAEAGYRDGAWVRSDSSHITINSYAILVVRPGDVRKPLTPNLQIIW